MSTMLHRLLSAGLLFVVISGCFPRAYGAPSTQEAELFARDERLYERYLSGDLETARQALHDLVKVYQAAGDGNKYHTLGQAHNLSVSYARLYMLEYRANRRELAEAYLVKARYWCLRFSELDGESEEQAAARIVKLDGPELIEIWGKWDRHHHAGKDADYVKELSAAK
jgi:hypothetical protein